MVDPTGTAGKGPPPDDLTTIYEGGTNFMARMAALDQRRREHENAYLRLKIGADAKAAFDEANSKLTAAAAAEKVAQEALAQARTKAAAMVADAQKAAEGVAKAAVAKKELAEKASAKVMSDADAYAKHVKGEVDGALAAAKDASRQAKDAQKRSDAATVAAEAAMHLAEEKAAAADAKAEDFKVRIERLNAAVRTVAT